MRVLLAVPLAALALVVPDHLAAVPAASGPDGQGRRVLTFQDPAITEASGLVDLGDLMVVTNDSGAEAVVQVVDGRGRTVGRTTYAAQAWDVEALAPAGPSSVFVGDIGDNRSVRSSIRLWEVPVGRGDRTVAAPSYELTYPDGAHDAESLLRWRGRLYVVTKSVTGGGIYAAPQPLRSGPLERVGSVSVWATDAAAFPGSSVALVRGYGSAVAVRLPEGRLIDTLDLPPQRQGEALSIGPARRVRVTSEGAHQDVLQVPRPGWLERAVRWSAVVDASWAGAILTP